MDLKTDFNEETIPLLDDYEGRVTATLVSAKANTNGRKSILYIHGFVDYFFQVHMAEQFLNHGYDFYALDLRKYGRSLLAHQHPNYCRSMTEYFPEISYSLEKIRSQNPNEIILLGHSTGGLLATLYVYEGEHRDLIGRLMLNSPFFEFNLHRIKRFFLPLIAGFNSFVFKYSKVKEALNRVYAHSINIGSHGEWDFNQQWKPVEGFPAYFAWINAVYKAQKKIKNSPNIEIPVLVLYSDKSLWPKAFTTEAHKTDTVLNVKDIARIGAQLGDRVTLVPISDGMHDLILSQKKVRDRVFSEIFGWLDAGSQ